MTQQAKLIRVLISLIKIDSIKAQKKQFFKLNKSNKLKKQVITKEINHKIKIIKIRAIYLLKKSKKKLKTKLQFWRMKERGKVMSQMMET